MNPFLDFLESFVAGWKRARNVPKLPEHTTDTSDARSRVSEWIVLPPTDADRGGPGDSIGTRGIGGPTESPPSPKAHSGLGTPSPEPNDAPPKPGA